MRRRVVGVCCCVVLAIGVPSRATTIRKVPFSSVCGRSVTVFVGRVMSTESRRSEPRGSIHTYTTFAVSRWVRGGDGGETYTVRTLGGAVAGERLIVHGMPAFNIGVRYVVFLRAVGDGVCPVVGWQQGCFRVRVEQRGQPEVVGYGGRLIDRIDAGRIVWIDRPTTRGRAFRSISLETFLNRAREMIPPSTDPPLESTPR